MGTGFAHHPSADRGRPAFPGEGFFMGGVIMSRRGLPLAAACGALALLLASAQISSAQMFVGVGGGRVFVGAPGYRGFGSPIAYGPGFYGGYTGYPAGFGPIYYPGYGYYPGGYNIPAYTQNFNPGYGNPAYTNLYNSPGYYSSGYATGAAARPLTYGEIGPSRYQAFYPSVAPPAADNPANVATVDVILPTDDAELTFEGQPTKQTGKQRAFQTPPLEPGQRYVYDVHAKWTGADGKPVDEPRKVRVKAGDKITIDFTKPAP
jgi:uncharacterized protein (TIGR03000 family)